MNGRTKALIEQRTEITEKIKGVLIDRLDLKAEPNEIAEDAPLFGMGLALDSIDALVLIVGIEDQFDITVDTADHHIYRSINTLADHIIGVATPEAVTAHA